MATSIVKLHVLSGAGEGGPPCYILQVDEFHCLLDCGWYDGVDREYVKSLMLWVKHIDAVLLSHQTPRHLGLLPYLVGSCGLKCPIYATTPVYKMGQLVMYDFYQSLYTSEDFDAFNLDDVDAAFSLVTQVNYQQTVNLPGRGRGLCITPLPSGHTLGGTIWKLVKEDTDIVYAVDFNHKKDRHLNGATFDACMRPRLLILDASNTLYTHPRRKDRDENLRHCILKTLRRGGNVLIAVDSAGRCLEIAHFLEQCWLNQDSGMMAYGLAMLSFVSFNVIDFAKSMVEWMSEKVMRTFEDQRTNPFHFKHLQLCHTLEQLDGVPEPKVVLASASDLSCGFSRQLFAEWADNDLNTVILTSQEIESQSTIGQQPTLLSRLIGLAKGEAEAREGLPTSSTGTLVLPLTLSQRVTAAQYERMQSEMPRIRNAVQTDAVPHAYGTSELDDNAISPMPSFNIPDQEEPSSFGTNSADFNNTSKSMDVDDTTSYPSSSVKPTEYDGSRLYDDSFSRPLASLNTTSLSDTVDRDQPTTTRLALTPVLHANTHHPTNDAAVDLNQLTTNQMTGLTFGRHQPGYDIYPGLHNHAGGQFFRMTKRTQLLFPQVEKKIHWDEYGGLIDPDLFAPTDKALSSPVDTKPLRGTKSVQPMIPTDLVIPPSILNCLTSKSAGLFDQPELQTRVVTHKLEIPLRCELVYLDYEGRSDGEAMKRIVIGLRPQELILVGSNRNAVEHLAAHCHSCMMIQQELIHTPYVSEVVNCTKEGDIYQARMKDSLVSSLKFTKIRDYELAWVEATVSLEDESPEQYIADNSIVGDDAKSRPPMAADQLPVLNLPTGPVGSHETVFVNEPKLSDLKQILLSQGLMAEFVSGVLVVDNCVAIKRSEAGKLLLEGLLSRTYFDVRQILYQQFAIL